VLILLDMDEVLADFVGGALRANGWPPEDPRTPGQWDLVEAMGIDEKEFWKPIWLDGADFWFNLGVLPQAREVVELVTSFGEDWLIVSSPPPPPVFVPEVYRGKHTWLVWNFPGTEERLVVLPRERKCSLANRETVLIDDNPKTIKQFNNAGGVGILYPTSLFYLRKKLQSIMGR